MSPGEQLPRSRVLKDANRIRDLLQGGRRRSGRHLTVYSSPSERPRAAFIVPKRYGNAVARNLTKRRLRELFRRHRDRFPADADLLLMIRAGRRGDPAARQTPKPGWQDLLRDLDGLFPTRVGSAYPDHPVSA